MNTVRDIEKWTFEDALPWWSEHGLDRKDGGYVEQFTFDGQPAAIDFKRTRVTCRQIYVFSHAALLGWKRGRELARHGFDFLVGKQWAGDGQGFARTTTRAGQTLDATADLYDDAFALFALSWYHRATGEAAALKWAHRTLDAIEAKLRHPSGEGFWHEVPSSGPRQQNPHMHLIEASLIAYETSKDQRFADLAKQIAELFRTKFFDLKSRTLAEFFNDDWTRASGDAGRIIEPGHQFEWAWILMNCRRLLGIDLSEEIRALVVFGEDHGVDHKSGVTYNQVRDDGQPIDRGSRSWPNTERLKAAVALWELDRRDPTAVFDSSGRLLLDRYLDVKPRGLWIDAFSADGKPLSKSVPASTLYHVFLAFAEVLRVSEARAH